MMTSNAVTGNGWYRRSPESSPSPSADPPLRLSRAVGIGLRAPHYQALLASRPAVGWLEVHAENYFGAGGQPLARLEQFHAHYPLSLHGVGLSLGSTDPLSRRHLSALRALIRRFDPTLVSEHLCWGSIGGRYLNDLLPLPYTRQSLEHVCGRVDEAQAFLGRQLLVENISSYLEFAPAAMPEAEFLAELARRTGCALLLDINNVYVSAVNHGFDARDYLRTLPVDAVAQFHLAGYDSVPGLLIDTHGKPVSDPVWCLFGEALHRFGVQPTLIEWDTDLPSLAALLAEAATATTIIEAFDASTARIAA